MSATTTQLLCSGDFCKLRYDTIPVKSASANVSFYTNNAKFQISSCDTLVANERYVYGIHLAEDKASVREFREQGDDPSSFSSAGEPCAHQWLSFRKKPNAVNIAMSFHVSVSKWRTYVPNYEYVEHSTS
jgi:hypothetical protein